MLIRNARQADIPAVTAMETVCFPEEPWPERFFVQAMDRTLVAEDNDAVIGYAVLFSVLDEGSLDNIAVDPAHRRRGVADALLDAVIQRAREKELAIVTLEVRESNGAGIGLYQKHGFVQAGRRTNYYERPREDAILMTLVL